MGLSLYKEMETLLLSPTAARHRRDAAISARLKFPSCLDGMCHYNPNHSPIAFPIRDADIPDISVWG